MARQSTGGSFQLSTRSGREKEFSVATVRTTPPRVMSVSTGIRRFIRRRVHIQSSNFGEEAEER
jgi:hypothetical protein